MTISIALAFALAPLVVAVVAGLVTWVVLALPDRKDKRT
jgi:hypothetical protein